MAKHEYVGVFGPEGDDEPEAIFADADAAQRYRRTTYGDRGLVAPVEVTPKAGRDVRDAVEAMRAPTVPAIAAPDPDAEEKGRIRVQLELEERRERLTKEVKAEMAEDERAAAKDTRPAERVEADAAKAREAQAEAQRESDEARASDAPSKPGK